LNFLANQKAIIPVVVFANKPTITIAIPIAITRGKGNAIHINWDGPDDKMQTMQEIMQN
jgi:hypothetical protein